MSETKKIKVKLPFGAGLVHFVGIGGIGMSGIAEVMHNLGYQVQGSDIDDSQNVARLINMGIEVKIGHDASHIKDAAAVIVSTAIKRDNPEIAAARASHIPVVKRADMLAELMRLKWNICVAGTHGKTTTTSMIAALMDAAGLDPTVINGGVINAYDTNARLGEGDWMVVEADESDGTFIRLPTTVGLITNIDPEHLDHYGSFDSLCRAFDQFIENTPFYGFGVVCLDHPEVQALVGRITDRRLITYGVNPQADVRAEKITYEDGRAIFTIVFRRQGVEEFRLDNISLPMPGVHNVLNALAAAIVARELGASEENIRKGFAAFGGVRRRFTKVAEIGGVSIIDDYGHHPVEISAVLTAARQIASGKVIAVVQPHRYSRLESLFDGFCACMNEADTVFITDIYTAGETPRPGITKEALADGVAGHGHRDVRVLSCWDDLPEVLKRIVEPGDYVVVLGAGSSTNYASALPQQLAKRDI